MELSKRLKTIVSLIDQSVIADIGCDHALVCIEAIETKKAAKAYACDLREGPIAQAKANVAAKNLSSKIDVRLQNGIENLPDDTKEILIAGMGGKLVIEILDSHPLPKNTKSLLLSSHKDTESLRRYLIERGWQIESERVVEDGHFYPILKVRIPDEQKPEQQDKKAMDLTIQKQLADEESLLFGFSYTADEDYLHYLRWQISQWEKILPALPQDRKAMLDHKLALADHRLKEAESQTRLLAGNDHSGRLSIASAKQKK